MALLVVAFFLPGYFLVNSVYPRRGSLGGELDLLYRVFLGVVVSVSLVVVYGTALVILGEGTGQVLFRPEYLWPGLVVLSVVFFLVGVLRGAYPKLSAALGRSVPGDQTRPSPKTEVLDRLSEVSARLEEARRQAATDPEQAARMKGLIAELELEKTRLEEEAIKEW